MGVVYKARQRGLNRLVALKMIRGGSQARAEQFARFRVEAEAVARLRHPNIVQIYEIGEADGLPFVALELLEGGGLDDRLAGTPQPGRQAAELVVTLARAVHAAHQAGIVHRDLKPANVLFTADGVPKITDFGLAKRIDADDGQTESGQIMGTPSYMAPEQAQGHARDVGPAADVYALGAILYEMLTGRPPFKGETPMETVRQVVDDEPVPPSRLVPRVAARPGDDLPEVPAEGAGQAVRIGRRRWPTTCSGSSTASRSWPGGRPPGSARPSGRGGGRRRPGRGLRPPGTGGGRRLALRLAGVAIEAQPDDPGGRGRRVPPGARGRRGRVATRTGSLARRAGPHRRSSCHGSRTCGTTNGRRPRSPPRGAPGRRCASRSIDWNRSRSRSATARRTSDSGSQVSRDRYNQALFHDTQFTGLDLPDNQEATRRAAVARAGCLCGSRVRAIPGRSDRCR